VIVAQVSSRNIFCRHCTTWGCWGSLMQIARLSISDPKRKFLVQMLV